MQVQNPLTYRLMKKSIYSLFVAAIVSVTAVCAQAAETISEAVVLKVSGTAQATQPGAAPVDIKVGDKLPQGTVITTSSSSEVEVQTSPGSVTTIESDTTADLSKLSITTENGAVTKQSAIVDVKVGSVVAKLDPAKRAINDYSVRTPRGVAAARGTEYRVTVYSDGAVVVAVNKGSVRFTNPKTNQSVLVGTGQSVTIAADGTMRGPFRTTIHIPSRWDLDEDGNLFAVYERGTIDPTIIVSPSS